MKLFKKIWSIITTLLVAVVVVLAVLLFGVRLLGLKPYSVLSGSMEPTYHTGSLIYVKKVDASALQTGDPITFMLDEDTVATHRIIEVIPDPEDAAVVRYQTQGDANEEADGGTVHCNNIIGKPVFTIPYLGYIANYIQHPPGTYAAIAVGAVLLILVILPDLFVKEKKSDEIEDLEKQENTKQG